MIDKQQANFGEREIEHLLQTVSPDLAGDDFATLHRELRQRIAFLIQHDFERLVRLLYTVDVDEKRLKTLLQQNPQIDAAETIATLLIERQRQKALTRLQFRDLGAEDEKEERW